MKKILLIAKKEFLDMFRDKRTLMRMIIIPLVAFPVIIYMITTLQASESKKEATKELVVGYCLNGQSTAMIERMDTTAHFKFVAFQDTASMSQAVSSDSINLAIWFSPTFDADYTAGKQAKYGTFYRSADMEEFDRFSELIAAQEDYLVKERLAQNQLPVDYVKPIYADKDAPGANKSSIKETIAKYAGGILPYIFMAFCFMGCMLPAIDLFAGEKERGTIETLLVTPVNRVHILVGKMIVVTAFGLLSATVALVGLIGSLYLMEIDPQINAIISMVITPKLVVMLYLLLVPTAIFFAGIMIPVSVYSRSFKEAQSILTPLNMAVIIPTMVGFLPGIELDYTTAFIPIVNVVLATKAMIGGNPEIGPIVITFASLILLSAVAVFISFKQFGKEENVLR